MSTFQKIWAFVFLMLNAPFMSAQNFEVISPDGSLTARVQVGDEITLAILSGETVILPASPIGLRINGQWLGQGQPVVATEENGVRNTLQPVVAQKSTTVVEKYEERQLHFMQGFSLTIRAYDEGIAYRFALDTADPEVTVNEEKAVFRFGPADRVYYPEEESFYSHNERIYQHYSLAEISSNQLASLPTLVRTQAGPLVLITESNLRDYAGMWLRGMDGEGLQAVFPHYPAAEKAEGDRDVRVEERKDFIARTFGRRAFPWRILAVARQDAGLVANQLTYLLSDPPQDDFSWVRPGKVAWDWYNANNLYGVDFRAGINTETYKYYIDFAAKYGIEYIILDEGWSPTDDLLSVHPELDLPELFAYAKSKNVGIIPWVLWNALDRQLEAALDQFAAWGAVGIKVDFMQRDDQKMVNCYWKIAEAAAKRKLMVDFHGSYKPAGLHRTYANVITREGVYGLEQSKWDTDKQIGPEHNVTLPFIRMAAGPMDYTPGAMRNAQYDNWHPVFTRPASLGTRCHQLAMYVVYESPLQMLADSPSNYLREPECMELLAVVPSIWQDTRPLAGKVGDYILVARQALNGDWYVGAMTDWDARELELDLSFLPEGNYRAQIWRDGPNADRFAEDFQYLERTVTPQDKLTISLAPGGGWVMRVVEE